VGKFPASHQAVQYPTWICLVCKEIGADCREAPLEGEARTSEVRISFLLPRQLVVLLETRGASASDIRQLIQFVWGRMGRAAKRFIRTGNNPCRKRHAGFRMKVRVKGLAVDLYLILANKSSGVPALSVRLVYGGGNAVCT
jgi:hypothetical protein